MNSHRKVQVYSNYVITSPSTEHTKAVCALLYLLRVRITDFKHLIAFPAYSIHHKMYRVADLHTRVYLLSGTIIITVSTFDDGDDNEIVYEVDCKKCNFLDSTLYRSWSVYEAFSSCEHVERWI